MVQPRVFGAKRVLSAPLLQCAHMPDSNFADPSTLDEWSAEITKRDRHGKDHVLSSRWTLIRGAAGEPRAFLTIDTDITEKKQREAQFLRAQRLESIGVLAGGIAHDLNNMLTPITMSVDVLKRLHRDGDTARLLESIDSCARRGADLVRQVLGFARGVEGKRLLVNPAFVAGDIASANVPVIVKPLVDLPASFERLGATLENAARMHAAGVSVAIGTGGFDPHDSRNLKHAAGVAAANGMPVDAALAAITSVPADVWGANAHYGRLVPGMDADVVVWSGDPLELTTLVRHVFIRGVEMPATTRQRLLFERYRDTEALPQSYDRAAP